MNVNLIIKQVILLQGFFLPSQIQMLLLYIVVNSVKNCNHENKIYFKVQYLLVCVGEKCLLRIVREVSITLIICLRPTFSFGSRRYVPVDTYN